MNTAIFFRIWRFIRIPLIAILVLLLVLSSIAYRLSWKSKKQMKPCLHTRAKITLDDVMGKNLPPDPGADADKTVQGIDVNQNGIRDDVELAIFREYPDSAKTRAVLLQYALALQMEATQKIVNKETVTEVVREQSRAYSCVGEIFSREDMNKYIEESDKLNFLLVKDNETHQRGKRHGKILLKI